MEPHHHQNTVFDFLVKLKLDAPYLKKLLPYLKNFAGYLRGNIFNICRLGISNNIIHYKHPTLSLMETSHQNTTSDALYINESIDGP
jgi:hypothetical protein